MTSIADIHIRYTYICTYSCTIRVITWCSNSFICMRECGICKYTCIQCMYILFVYVYIQIQAVVLKNNRQKVDTHTNIPASYQYIYPCVSVSLYALAPLYALALNRAANIAFTFSSSQFEIKGVCLYRDYRCARRLGCGLGTGQWK